jgi:hypothetical protein
MNTVVSTHKIPAALAALTPLVLSSITMQLFGAIERLAACSKIKQDGFDCGKSSPLIL